MRHRLTALRYRRRSGPDAIRKGAHEGFPLSQLRAAPGVRELGLPVVRQRAGVLPGRHGVCWLSPRAKTASSAARSTPASINCANLHVAECNWLVKVNSDIAAVAELCTSL